MHSLPCTCAGSPIINIPTRVIHLWPSMKLHGHIYSLRVHSLHRGSLLLLYILWIVSFLKILFALYLVAKTLADLGPHLCQVHWNHRPSYKVIMPRSDPILSSWRVPHGKCLHFAISVPWVQLLITLDCGNSKKYIHLVLKYLMTLESWG